METAAFWRHPSDPWRIHDQYARQEQVIHEWPRCPSSIAELRSLMAHFAVHKRRLILFVRKITSVTFLFCVRKLLNISRFHTHLRSFLVRFTTRAVELGPADLFKLTDHRLNCLTSLRRSQPRFEDGRTIELNKACGGFMIPLRSSCWASAVCNFIQSRMKVIDFSRIYSGPCPMDASLGRALIV